LRFSEPQPNFASTATPNLGHAAGAWMMCNNGGAAGSALAGFFREIAVEKVISSVFCARIDDKRKVICNFAPLITQQTKQ
jgi:hypothetical protein